jgi:hypothetical protein
VHLAERPGGERAVELERVEHARGRPAPGGAQRLLHLAGAERRGRARRRPLEGRGDPVAQLGRQGRRVDEPV